MFQSYKALLAPYIIIILNIFDKFLIKQFYVNYQKVLSYQVVCDKLNIIKTR